MYWNSATELQGLVALGLTATVKRNLMQGWIRAGVIASDEANQKILALQNQVTELTSELVRVTSSPPSGVENLAQGDDEIEIEFKVSFASRERQYGLPVERRREKYAATVTWNSLFAAIAPNLTEPQKESKVRADIARYLRDAFEEEVQARQPEFVISSATIEETRFNTIRVQFEALGLISSRIGVVKKEQGAEREVRYCELTKFGRKELVRICAIYKA